MAAAAPQPAATSTPTAPPAPPTAHSSHAPGCILPSFLSSFLSSCLPPPPPTTPVPHLGRMDLCVSAWNSGSSARKSSMVRRQSRYAAQSRSASGSFLEATWNSLAYRGTRGGGRGTGTGSGLDVKEGAAREAPNGPQESTDRAGASARAQGPPAGAVSRADSGGTQQRQQQQQQRPPTCDPMASIFSTTSTHR